jgi:hypothetical protein
MLEWGCRMFNKGLKIQYNNGHAKVSQRKTDRTGVWIYNGMNEKEKGLRESVEVPGQIKENQEE